MRRRTLLSRIQGGDSTITQRDLDDACISRELFSLTEVRDMVKECAKYAHVPEAADDIDQNEYVHKMRSTCTNTLLYKLGLPADDPYGAWAQQGQ